MPDDVKLPPAGTGDSSTTFFDTAALKAEAKAFTPSTPAVAVAPVVPAKPSAGAPSFTDAIKQDVKPAPGEQAPAATPAGATATPPAQPDALDIPDTQIVKFTTKVDGVEKVEYIPYGEVRTRGMLRQHYTKEMQELRAKEEQVNATLAEQATLKEQAARAARYEQILTTEDSLTQYLNAAFPGKFSRAEIAKAAAQIDSGVQPTGAIAAAVTQDPSDIASLGDTAAIVAAKTKELEQHFGRTLSNVEKAVIARAEELFANVNDVVDNRLRTIAKAQKVSAFDSQIAQRIDTILEQHPHVKAFGEDVADVIRHNVVKLKPKTPEEMFQAIDNEVLWRSEAVLNAVNATRTVELANKAALVAKGVEPPNGTPVALPQKDTFQKADGSWDWDGLKAQARSWQRS